MWALALLGNALLRASNQSVLHVCIIVYSSQSVYCSFITCCLTVNIVGQHLATYFAEWQKANTLMSCSTYAGNVDIEQLNCFVFLTMKSTKLVWHWYGFNLSSFVIKVNSHALFIAHLQNKEIRTGNKVKGCPSSFSALLLHVAAPYCGWVLVKRDCSRVCG